MNKGFFEKLFQLVNAKNEEETVVKGTSLDQRSKVESETKEFKISQFPEPADEGEFLTWWRIIVQEVKDLIPQSEASEKDLISDGKGLSLFSNGKTRGFAINTRSMGMSDQDALILLRHLHQAAFKMGYREKLAEHKISPADETYRLYMKPSIYLQMGEKGNQLFGNLEILYSKNKGIPSGFRLLLHTYQDRLYEKALNFSDFMDQVN